MIQSHERPEEVVELDGVRKYRINIVEVVAEASTYYTYEEVEFNSAVPKDVTDGKIEKVKASRIAEEAKANKKLRLDTITVTTSQGNQFDGNETARGNMANAVLIAEATGVTEIVWKMADNSKANVSINEVKEALELAMKEVASIVLEEV